MTHNDRLMDMAAKPSLAWPQRIKAATLGLACLTACLLVSSVDSAWADPSDIKLVYAVPRYAGNGFFYTEYRVRFREGNHNICPGIVLVKYWDESICDFKYGSTQGPGLMSPLVQLGNFRYPSNQPQNYSVWNMGVDLELTTIKHLFEVWTAYPGRQAYCDDNDGWRYTVCTPIMFPGFERYTNGWGDIGGDICMLEAKLSMRKPESLWLPRHTYGIDCSILVDERPWRSLDYQVGLYVTTNDLATTSRSAASWKLLRATPTPEAQWGGPGGFMKWDVAGTIGVGSRMAATQSWKAVPNEGKHFSFLVVAAPAYEELPENGLPDFNDIEAICDDNNGYGYGLDFFVPSLQ